MAMVMVSRGRKGNGAETRRAVAATRSTDGAGRRSRRDGDRERQGKVAGYRTSGEESMVVMLELRAVDGGGEHSDEAEMMITLKKGWRCSLLVDSRRGQG